MGHRIFNAAGRVDRGRLEKLERLLGRPLPETYREMLLEHGGFQAGQEDCPVTFFGLDGGSEIGQLDWLIEKGNRGDGLYPEPSAVLAVGATETGILVFVGVAERRGEVFFGKDMDGGGAGDPEGADDPNAVRWENLEWVARDFDDFLERLRVESAVVEGDVETIEAYLDLGHDINAKVLGSTLLEDAIAWDQVGLIELLYGRGADGASADTAWYTAMDDAGRRATFGAFLAGVKDVNAFGSDGAGNSLLFTALLKDRLDVARELLGRGAKIGEDCRRLAANQAAKGRGEAKALLDEWGRG